MVFCPTFGVQFNLMCFQGTLTKNMAFLCQGVTQELDIFYVRTAAGEVRQASCSTNFFICSKIPVDLHFFALHRKSPTVFSIVLVQLSDQTRTSSIYFDYKCRFGAIAYARISQNSHKVSILSIGRPSARSFSCTSST